MCRSVLGFHKTSRKERVPESAETINIMEISISYLLMIIMTQ